MRADTGTGSLTGANGCTSAAMAALFVLLVYGKLYGAFSKFKNFFEARIWGCKKTAVLRE